MAKPGLKCQTTVEYLVEKVAVGHEGGFRKAYKATTKHARFKHKAWVLKRYHPEAVKNIVDTGVGIDEHTKKAVQMHLLARNFASQLTSSLALEAAIKFGETFRYRNVYYGKTKEGECVRIEEFIDGKFRKYLNNTGLLCGDVCPTSCMKNPRERFFWWIFKVVGLNFMTQK